MRLPPWKVGELARRTGLSVRTLHWYDQIGLLAPSHYTESGHRLYTTGDVARLQQIKSLRTMYQQEQTIHGMDVLAMRPMMEYIDKAIAVVKKPK